MRDSTITIKPRDWLMVVGMLLALNIGPAWAADNAPKSAPQWIRSVQSGPWSAAATWEGGKVPAAGTRVQVRTGHTVIYDAKSDQTIRAIHVAGTLRFATDRDTQLNVGLIKIQPGDDASEDGFNCDVHMPAQPRVASEDRPVLEIGSLEKPLPSQHHALVRLVYVEGMDRESCPAIICCGGRMDFHGAPMRRTWVKLGATAKTGDKSVTLPESVPGWRARDRVIITATQKTYRNKGSFTEERTIQSVDDKRLILDQPLEHEHQGDGDYRGEIANLSRNVIVESADPEGVRGHTMYHRNSSGSISYAEFRHLGKEGVLGKYALHYHLVGSSMRGSSVVGASIWDSRNRWLTIHGTNYLVVRDCVGYRSIGHGFFLEDGTEIANVFDHNLAVGARHGKKLPKQVLPFDGNEGAGFWWANSLNTFTGNVATENDQYGFRFEATPTSALKLVLPILQSDGSHKDVDIRTLPFIRFQDNEVHSNVGLYGINLGEGVNRVGPDPRHPFVVRNTKIWDIHYAFRPQVPSLLVEHMTIWRAAYGVYHPNFDHHAYHDLYIGQTNTEPFNRGHDDLSAQYGVLTVDGLTFDGIRSGDSMPLIQISDDNPTGDAVSHFRNVKLVNWTGTKKRALVNLGGGPRPTPKTAKGVPIYLHDWFGPGRTAEVVSTKSAEYRADTTRFHEEPLMTGDESRAAEVRDIPFPRVLDPVDDLPPATVITHVVRNDEKLVIRGTATDNGAIRKVMVNGQEARATKPNFAEWEIVLEKTGSGALKLTAHAEDEAGNVERMPHVVSMGAEARRNASN